jgi:hypothetical protein
MRPERIFSGRVSLSCAWGLKGVPTWNMNYQILATLLLAAAATSALADSRLVGNWEAADANKGALKGTLDISAKGTVSIKAAEQPPLEGTWVAKKRSKLEFTVPQYGTAFMDYRVTKTGLEITYDNGNIQHFVKSAKPPAALTTQDVSTTPALPKKAR